MEANPVHHYHIWDQRRCSLVPACASDVRQRLRFSSNSREPSGGSSKVSSSAATSASLTIPCDTLTHMLQRSGIRHVDVLSLDVEGHENSVLMGLNFSRISFGVILMEPSCHRLPQGCAILRQAGYTQIRDASFVDHAWVRNYNPAANGTARYRCRSHGDAGHCRGWDYRGAPDYAEAGSRHGSSPVDLRSSREATSHRATPPHGRRVQPRAAGPATGQAPNAVSSVSSR